MIGRPNPSRSEGRSKSAARLYTDAGLFTCRTDDWLRLVEADKQWRKAEEERKAKQAERHGNALKGGLAVGMKIAEIVLKKK